MCNTNNLTSLYQQKAKFFQELQSKNLHND